MKTPLLFLCILAGALISRHLHAQDAAALKVIAPGSFARPIKILAAALIPSIASKPAGNLVVQSAGGEISFQYPADFMAIYRRIPEQVSVKNSKLVFTSHGIKTIGYNWNIYTKLNVKGYDPIIFSRPVLYISLNTAINSLKKDYVIKMIATYNHLSYHFPDNEFNLVTWVMDGRIALDADYHLNIGCSFPG